MSDVDAVMRERDRLREALVNLERQVTELYRLVTPGGNYGANAVGSERNENTFADRDQFVLAARAALTPENPS